MHKKILVYLISFILTLAGVYCVMFFLSKILKKSEMIKLSSIISFYNKKGIIKDNNILLKDCINSDENMEMQIKLENKSPQNTEYCFSIFINYIQQEFEVNDKSTRITNYNIVLKSNEIKKIKIKINKRMIKNKINPLLVNIVQNPKQHVSDIKILDSSTTLNYRFNVIDKKNTPDTTVVPQYLDVSKSKLIKIKTNGLYFSINENISDLHDNTVPEYSIYAKKGQILRLGARLGGAADSEEYIVWGCIDSKQINVSGKSYLALKIPKGKQGFQELEFKVPDKNGKYEIQFFVAPLPFLTIDMSKQNKFDILASIRHTLIVE